MAPKKKGGGGKKKSAKPAWMSDEMYALSQHLPKLQEYWCGDIKESKGKGKDGKPLPDFPNISKEQAGLFMLALLFPNNKAAKERREDCIKLGVIETCVTIISKGKPEEITPALNIIACLAGSIDQCRNVFLDNKPSPLPGLLRAFQHGSTSMGAAACQLLKVLASFEDSRQRVWKAMRDWDWAPLTECLVMQHMSALGGRNMALDCAVALQLLCGAPELSIADGACAAVVAGGGLPRLVALLEERVSHPLAVGAALSVMYAVCRRNPMALARQLLVDEQGLQAIAKLLDHPIVPLISKAHSAAVLLRFVMPDKLWHDSAVLAQPKAGGSKPKAQKSAPPPDTAFADAAATGAAAAAATAAAAAVASAAAQPAEQSASLECPLAVKHARARQMSMPWAWRLQLRRKHLPPLLLQPQLRRCPWTPPCRRWGCRCRFCWRWRSACRVGKCSRRRRWLSSTLYRRRRSSAAAT
uniref:Uncharacterized protein n=1 Tax=Chlamydomonas euryale TaxID=1486919 RepID=A0A7R9YSV6_9CHLO|mmetsp:Transcript_19926/g.59196  ORF Transcript_19926/g.59196 Transcript_19926/m.59196 type:complete len:470 (+) Transcript_19926:600-2009(+)